ncbi:MAG: sigma-54 dependent transcriptional regulator [Methylotenera sp.]
MNNLKRILAVDDESSMRRLLEISLKQAGYLPILAADGFEALSILRKGGIDLVVSDLHMPGMDGLRLFKKMNEEGLQIPVIIVTAKGEVGSAVEAMKLGASDYIQRPFDLEALEIAIEKALSVSRLKVENAFLKEETQQADNLLIGNSLAMQKVKELIFQVAPEKATAFLVGETGTGKELVAQAIHQHSTRNNALFVALNCAAIPAEMMESELFGHERGAFTGAVKERIGKFEMADGGTLFLDEITEMPIALQAKLLRVLQESVVERLGSNLPINVDVRIIAATNRNPLEAIKEGKLREDLYYRLNVFQIKIPLLHERYGDIPLLTKYFLANKKKEISERAMLVLAEYRWPGNVRELENVLERAAIISKSSMIEIADLPMDIQSVGVTDIINLDSQPTNLHLLATETSLSIPAATGLLEKQMIAEALSRTKGNKSKAAKLLEISERTLWYKVREYNMVD